MNTIHFLSAQASRIKGRNVTIHPDLTASYLARLACTRIAMKLRGFVRCPSHTHKPFIGKHVTILESSNLHFGHGVTIARNCYIDAMSTAGVVIGDGSTLGVNSRIECTGSVQFVGKGITVGNRVGMGTDTLYGCAGGIEIGDDTIIGNFVSFHSENHVIEDRTRPIQDQGVTHQGIRIGRDCWIGSRSAILDGANVGEGCVIAAGSVVTAGQYDDFGIFGGVPAKRIGTRGVADE